MISTLGTKYTNATFFHFDMNGLFTQVLDDPTYSTITQVYQDTTHTCKPYTNSPLPSMNYKSPDCAYPVNEYFWLNGYHPTYPVHDLTAAEIAYGLRSL